MSATAIFAPSRAKRRAMAPPMPPPPPVTIATLFSNDAMDSDTSRCLPVLAAGLSFEIDKQFVEILNSLHSRMIERLIIGAMRHEHDRFGVFRYIAAVLMSIIDEHVDVQFSDQLGLVVLREINHRMADPMFSEPIAGNLADIVGLPLVAMSDENQIICAAAPAH